MYKLEINDDYEMDCLTEAVQDQLGAVMESLNSDPAEEGYIEDDIQQLIRNRDALQAILDRLVMLR